MKTIYELANEARGLYGTRENATKQRDDLPRFDTKEEAEKAIKDNPMYRSFTPTFISDHYAEAYGLKRGGWYFYSKNKTRFTID